MNRAGASVGAALAAVLAAAACATSSAAPPEAGGRPIDLFYFDRPPYALRQPGSGEVTGLTATPAARAFNAAGIPYRWVQMPTVRQLVTLKEYTAPACAVGWFRNAERAQLYKFTVPIYRDRPAAAISRADFLPAATLAETLRRPGVSVLVKDGFSYGPVIDQMLAQYRPERVVTSAESVAMVNMIAAQRANLMIAAEEEAAFLVEQSELEAHLPYPLKILRFADLPPGEWRYILCSKVTPDSIIERLDKVIAPLP